MPHLDMSAWAIEKVTSLPMRFNHEFCPAAGIARLRCLRLAAVLDWMLTVLKVRWLVFARMHL